MGGGGHDVRADERLLKHLMVDGFVVAARPPVTGGDGAVGGAQQRARAAGQVGDAERFHRIGVSPIHLKAHDGELGEERGGRGAGVEGGEEFPVGDQLAKHLPREIVHRRHAMPSRSRATRTRRCRTARAVRSGSGSRILVAVLKIGQ